MPGCNGRDTGWRHRPTRKRADFRTVIHGERDFDKSLYGERQMTAIDAKATGAGGVLARCAEMGSGELVADGGRREATSGAYRRRQPGKADGAKVLALQRLLTRSHSGKMLAAKRVTEESR